MLIFSCLSTWQIKFSQESSSDQSTKNGNIPNGNFPLKFDGEEEDEESGKEPQLGSSEILLSSFCPKSFPKAHYLLWLTTRLRKTRLDSRPDYQPLFRKWFSALPQTASSRVGLRRERQKWAYWSGTQSEINSWSRHLGMFWMFLKKIVKMSCTMGFFLFESAESCLLLISEVFCGEQQEHFFGRPNPPAGHYDHTWLKPETGREKCLAPRLNSSLWKSINL